MKLTDRKRQDILDAAIAEFREKGFRAAHVTAIAARANVSKRTLYRHFASKEALLDEIIDIVMARNASVRHVVFDASIPVRDQLISEVEAIVAEVSDDDYISLNRLIASEYLIDKQLALKIFSRAEVQGDAVAQLIRDAMAEGALRHADPAFAALQLNGLIKQFFVWPHFLLGEKPTFEQRDTEIIEACVDMFLAHYTPSNS